MSNQDFISMVALFALIVMAITYSNNYQTKLMQKWDTCVAQQQVEGALFEEFMKQCMN
jgi:hypothetical protein